MSPATIMEKSRVIKTEFGEVTVKKLALYEYAKLIESLKKAPVELAELFNSDKDVQDRNVLFEELPGILAKSMPDFIGIISAGTDKDTDFIEQLDLADALEIIDAMLELNNYQKVVSTVKKIMARSSSAPKQSDKKESKTQ